MKAVRELACDAYVLEVLGEAEAVPYGLTIIEFLKRFSSHRDQPNLLYFYGSNNDNQMARRIKMIRSFKKGSYKLSAIAVICVAVLSTVTLTNAAKPAEVSSPQDQSASTTVFAKDRVLFESSSRSYNNLEKAVKVADFKFKVPSVLPEGYKFESAQVRFTSRNSDENMLAAVKVFFGGKGERFALGTIEFSAKVNNIAGLGSAYAAILLYEENGIEQKGELMIKKEPLNIGGLEGLKVTVGTGKKEKFYYLWQEGNIEYQIKGFASFTGQDFLTLMSAMKYPDQEMNARYVGEDMLISRVYDTGDLRRVPESLGFTPKVPLELPGQIKAVSAFVTQKINFSYPIDEVDKKTKLITFGYATSRDSNSEIESKVKNFDFMQIKNNNIYEDIKKNGYVDFYRIDGERNKAKVSVMDIKGVEVLKTDKYKIDGELSSPDEVDFVSYFWKKDEVCYQVAFKGDGLQQMEIVASLMDSPIVNLDELK
ncbi:hypothetical protein D3C73_749270 [compost metagenome]